MAQEYVEIRIPRSLYEKLSELVKSMGGYNSVEEFVVSVLEELVQEGMGGAEHMSREDEEKVKERLRALGYI